jgi:mono/diheme cytochrome c family protein
MKSLKPTVALSAGILLILSACHEGVNKDTPAVNIHEMIKDTTQHAPEVKQDEIKLDNPLNAQWVTSGKATYDLKCQSCHRLTEEKLVGPGWKGVTKRRTPTWIMNMVMNTEMMLNNDDEAKKLLEFCMVRMPNQNLSKDQAREVIEFMRNNDGEK